TPSPAAAGASITVTDTTKNQGTAQAAASTTRIYFSLHATLDGTETTSVDRDVPSLNAVSSSSGSISSGSTTLTIPAGTAPGTYYLIAVADASNAVVESKEDNNTTTQKIEVAAPPLPDLVVSALSAPSSVAPGASITVTDTTANQGTAQAAASTTRIYLDGTPIVARAVPALDALGSSSGSTSVIIPAGTAPGPHSLIVVANDAPNTVAESNGTNNTKIQSITVYTPPPSDLIVSAISAPSSVLAGASITVTDTTKNQGTGQT